VVFIAPEQIAGQPERDFIKRVIGLPGETVEIKDCTVFINGEPLDEPYLLGQTNSSYEQRVVPPDHYFVLGDNRDNSRDSRASEIGMIPKENLIGKAWLTYWPFDVFGLVDDTSVEPGAGSSETDKVASLQGAPSCN
jgi:signal peptidase I